jgi:hypothetical protein
MAKFKLTKKAAVAAYDEMVKELGGVSEELDRKLPDEEFYEEFAKQVSDLEIDDEDKAGFSKETNSVIEAITEKYPQGSDENDDDIDDVEEDDDDEDDPEEEEEVKPKKGKKEKEAPAKEEKKGKAKKEVAPPVVETKKGKKEKVVEAPPAKEAKKAKGKKGVDPAALAETIKTDKKLGVTGCIEMIDANPDLFGKNADTLKAIKNPMVLKKQMRNILEGGEITMTETKPREKAEKPEKSKKSKAEPTLAEQVEAIDDLDELIDFAKENKESFPGVKAKKFDKLKKLKKALLEVVVEKAPAKSEKKAVKAKNPEKRDAVVDYLTKVIEKAGGKIGRAKLQAAGVEKFPDAVKQVRDQISYGKNEKYNKFKELLIEVDGTIGFKSAMKGFKPEKKVSGKKEEAAPVKTNKRIAKVEPVKEEKSGKKNKKDKKKKKNKK